MGSRQSNIELLRIVSMSFILILHFTQWAIGIDNMNPFLYQALIILNNCGVNLFIMISGYFGIKWSINSFVKLAGLIICFSLFCLFCGVFIFDLQFTAAKIIKYIFLPFTSTGYWFLQCYLGLYLIAPLLTKGLNCLNSIKFKQFLAFMTFVTVFSCWYGGNKLNADSYGIFHFMYIYVLGYGLKKITLPSLQCKSWFFIAVLFLFANIVLSYGFDFYYDNFYNRYSWGAAKAYDNPFIICASISIFIMFVKLNIGSIKFINSIAGASLGCYLLQDGILRDNIYGLQRDYLIHNSAVKIILMFSISFILFWIISYFIYLLYTLLFKYTERKIINTIPYVNNSFS